MCVIIKQNINILKLLYKILKSIKKSPHNSFMMLILISKEN